MNDLRASTHASPVFAFALILAPTTPAVLPPPAPAAAGALSGALATEDASRAPRAESSFERAFRERFTRGAEASVPARAPSVEPTEPGPGASHDAAHEELPPASLATLGFAAPAHDTDDPTIPNHPALSDRFFIGLGAYYAETSTEMRLDSSVGVGTIVDFEEALGFDPTTLVPQGLARWRISERWRLELEHFRIDRDNTATLGQDINWGDQTFPAGTQIAADFDVAVTRLSCGYSFFKRQDKELGVALGFHVTDLEAGLSSTGGGGDEDGKLLAPLPVISLYGQVALTDTWALGGRLDAFKIEFDPYEGHIYSVGLDALYQPFRHFGFGLGWRALEMEVSADHDDWNGQASQTFSGPIAYLAASF